MFKFKTAGCAFIMICFVLSPALAHISDIAHQHGFTAGVIHPLIGLDHLLGMLGIGLCAGFVGGSARWSWPLSFVGFAGQAAYIGHAGYEIPAFEILIAASVILIGLLLISKKQISTLTGIVMSSGIGFVHGYAHGVEMPQDVGMATFILGFLLTTILLHGLGVLLSFQLKTASRTLLGGSIAAVGAYLLFLTV